MAWVLLLPLLMNEVNYWFSDKTEGILRILNERELRGVLALELSHIKKPRHPDWNGCSYYGRGHFHAREHAHWGMIFGGRSSEDRGGGHPIVALLMIIIAPLAAMLVQMAASVFASRTVRNGDSRDHRDGDSW